VGSREGLMSYPGSSEMTIEGGQAPVRLLKEVIDRDQSQCRGKKEEVQEVWVTYIHDSIEIG
jgi:hypothetical protein